MLWCGFHCLHKPLSRRLSLPVVASGGGPLFHWSNVGMQKKVRSYKGGGSSLLGTCIRGGPGQRPWALSQQALEGTARRGWGVVLMAPSPPLLHPCFLFIAYGCGDFREGAGRCCNTFADGRPLHGQCKA